MKKITACMLILTLLLSCIYVTHAAPIATNSTDMSGQLSNSGQRILDSSGAATGFTLSHNVNVDGKTSEFIIDGDAAKQKLPSDKMLMAQLFADGTKNTEWNRGLFGSAVQTFMPGQKIYMRAQYYFPSESRDGEVYGSYNDKFSMSVTGIYLNSSDVSETIALANMTHDTSDGGSFYFMGNSKNGIKANETWQYDTWYTIETIVTMGSQATVSVYVNGSPLTFDNSSISESVDYSTGKEYIKAAKNQRIYDLTCTPVKTGTMKRHMYTDNWAFDVYPAGEDVELWTPPKFNPVSFSSPKNGDEMRTNEFKTVNIDVIGQECDMVELYIDNELVASLDQTPYSFEISKRYSPGTHTLRAVAKSGNDEYEQTITVNLAAYNPLSFDGIANGEEVYDKKFKSVTVKVDDELCESVSLYIDNELVATQTEAPYSFELAKYLRPGEHSLRAEAVVADEEYEFETVINVLEYNPLSFANISADKKVYSDEFKTVTVLTGEEECDEVSLYIDDIEVSTITSSPYTFDIDEDYLPGNHTVRAVAQSGSDTYEISVNITLMSTYGKPVMNQNFDAYASFYEAQNGGWYYPSSRMNNAKAPNGWFIKPSNIKDKMSASYGQAMALGCDPGSSPSYNDANNTEYSYITFGYSGMAGAPISGHKAVVEWYMFFNNDKSVDMEMGLGTSTGQSIEKQIFKYDAESQKINWNVEGSPSTDIEVNKWQKYTLTIDFTQSSKMSLSVDGAEEFTNLTHNASVSSFSKIIWKYIPDYTTGSFVALDEVKITHVIPRPSLKSAKFYIDDEESSDYSKVSPDTNAIAIEIDGTLSDVNLAENVEFLENGKSITAYSPSGELLKPAVMLSGSKLWIVPHIPLMPACEYSVKLGAGAVFENNVEIGYDQYLNFVTSKGKFDIKSVSFSSNGSSASRVQNGDTISAKASVSNTTGKEKTVKLLLALYSDNKLMSISVKEVNIPSSSYLQTISANDVTVRNSSGFSASLIVLDNNNYPVAQYVMG